MAFFGDLYNFYNLRWIIEWKSIHIFREENPAQLSQFHLDVRNILWPNRKYLVCLICLGLEQELDCTVRIAGDILDWAIWLTLCCICIMMRGGIFSEI